MLPTDEALSALGLEGRVDVLSVPSGYPSPKYVNLVLRRLGGRTYLFESSAARPDIVSAVGEALDARSVGRLDALLVTHCHGDHGGAAGVHAGRGRAEGRRAPIYLHSAGYRFLTHPEPSFLHETYELFLARSQWGLLDYSTMSDEEILENAIRRRYGGYFERTPKSALSFVDHGNLPEGIVAVHTPGHSHDCCLFYDQAHQIAVPGDTMLTTGRPDEPATHAYAIPIFTIAGQVYSMAYVRFLRTIRVLRRFFETHPVKLVLPPHGRLAVTDPLGWCVFAVRYFEGIYGALLEDFFGDADAGWQGRSFRACDVSPYIASAGAHPVSTASHVAGMLCMLADDGFLSMKEHQHTRQLTFELERMPPPDYVHDLLAEDVRQLTVYGE